MNRKGFFKRFLLTSSTLLLTTKAFAKPAKKNVKKIDAEILPTLKNPKSTSIFYVGDTQRYSNDSVQQSVGAMIFAYIAKKQKFLNAQCALFTGDLVENNSAQCWGKESDVDSAGQWKYVSESFSKLDGKIPYIISLGNHDYGRMCFENRQTHFNELFPKERNPLTSSVLLEMFENSFGKKTLENACYEIDLGGNWGKVIIFAIEFCPRDEVLNWIHKKCTSDFANKKVFLLLHDYLRMNGEHTKKPSFAYVNVKAKPEFNGGQDIWEKLVKKTQNIRMVLCGHAGGKTPDLDANSHFKIVKNDANKDVAEMVFAMHGRPHDGHGADAWLKILEFDPDGKTVRVMTFSPYLFYSLDSKQRSRATNEKNEFSFELK